MSGTPSSTVALIGIGLLGSALAERLLRAGYRVRGYDLDPERLRAFAAAGGSPAVSAGAAAAGAGVVLTCLMTGETVRQAVLGPDGAAGGMAPGSVLVDVTTCAPQESRRLAADLRSRGIAMLDAPLSGGSALARAGELVALVGGEAEVFEHCQPLLRTFARHSLYLGENGAGTTAKLVTNLVLGLNRLALAEGLALGLRAGLDPEALLRALRESAAYSRVMDVKGERMLSGHFEPEARLAQHLKDVELILELGRESGAALPASALHRGLLASAVEQGWGDADNSAIFALLREMSRRESATSRFPAAEDPGG